MYIFELKVFCFVLLSYIIEYEFFFIQISVNWEQAQKSGSKQT